MNKDEFAVFLEKKYGVPYTADEKIIIKKFFILIDKNIYINVIHRFIFNKILKYDAMYNNNFFYLIKKLKKNNCLTKEKNYYDLLFKEYQYLEFFNFPLYEKWKVILSD